MINNFKCANCSHGMVCKIVDKLSPFRDGAKKNLGVTLTMIDCLEYDSDGQEDGDAEDDYDA